MERFINDKLRMLFICKNDKTMKELAHKTMTELSNLMPSDEVPEIIETTYKELMCDKGYFPELINKERLDGVARITIVTWFGNYKFYSAENRYTALCGTRENVLVLDDDLEFNKDTFLDCIEPIASEHGDMILLSKFNQCESKTKYSRQLHHYVKEIHANLVYNTVVKGE